MTLSLLAIAAPIALPFSVWLARRLESCIDRALWATEGNAMTTRAARHRYYAYERRDGSVCYLPKLLHEGIQRYPRTIAHYHLVQWLGVSKLLSCDEYKRMAWMGASCPMARHAAVV